MLSKHSATDLHTSAKLYFFNWICLFWEFNSEATVSWNQRIKSEFSMENHVTELLLSTSNFKPKALHNFKKQNFLFEFHGLTKIFTWVIPSIWLKIKPIKVKYMDIIFYSCGIRNMPRSQFKFFWISKCVISAHTYKKINS